MAIMWPKALPPDVLGNTLRGTECAVYRRLEAVLDDSFVVFYSRPWLGLKPDGEEIDGECDFVIAHAELGMLTLEVKGGAVAYDPASDRWTSRDRWNITHHIKNPVHQARSSKHELLKKLKASSYWKPRRIRARHGIVLPHSSAPVGDLGADMPQKIFCFASEYGSGFRSWIMRRFDETEEDEDRTKGLGQDGLHALERILAKPFRLHTPLGTLLSDDDAALQVLTQQQFHILRAIEAIPRVAVCGGAGTGKTVLAMEEAQRCAENGNRTLFVCYNRGLAVEVRRKLSGGPTVSVKTFHELCEEMSRKAGLEQPEALAEKLLFEEILPELLMQAFDCLPDEAFDAVIVDEGQDFLPPWWAALEAGLNPKSSRRLRVFYDSNQRVYSTVTQLPKDVSLVPIRLTLNLRNTKRIHELVHQHYAGHEIEAVGPEGVEVRWVRVEKENGLKSCICEYVKRLISVEQVLEEDMAILFSDQKAIEGLVVNSCLGNFRIVRCDEESNGRIVLDSVRRFKGLERRVVFVIVTADVALNTELLYVGLSRARTHLVIIGDDKTLGKIRNQEAISW